MPHILEVDRVSKIFKRRGGGEVLAVDNATFTIDDERSIRKAVDMGVHGIASNRPELLLPY